MLIKIPIPEETEVLVKKGDKIDFNTLIFDVNSFEKININISEKLKVNQKKIFNYLKKLVGEKIKKDDIIAEKKGVFFSFKVNSPADGIIEEVNHNTGEVIIKVKTDKKLSHFSFFKGIIHSVEKNFLEIKLNQAVSFLLKNKSEKNIGGKFFKFDSSLFFQIKSDDIENKIIIAEKLTSFEQVKLEALGAKAFVTIESLPEKTDLPFFRFKNIEDFKKIKKENFLYCTLIENSDKIYFYI